MKKFLPHLKSNISNLNFCLNIEYLGIKLIKC